MESLTENSNALKQWNLLFTSTVPLDAFSQIPRMNTGDTTTIHMVEECKKKPECFTVSFMQSYGMAAPPDVYTHFFCKDYIVSHYRPSDQYLIRPHKLPFEVLMTIRHFQISSQDDHIFYKGLTLYNEHPDYFQAQLRQKLEDIEMKTTLEKIEKDKKSIEKGCNRLMELRDAIQVERRDLKIDKIEFAKKKQQHENELLKMREEQTELEKDRDYYRDIVESFRKDLYALFPSESSS